MLRRALVEVDLPREDPQRAVVISVVVPARNAEASIGAQLDALAAQTFRGSWEVIVADNGSTDGTRQRALAVRDRVPGLRVVDASGRSSVNRARNVGATAARGDYVLFCDADDVATPTWLEAMAAAASSCDAVGGALDKTMLNARGTPPGGGERTDGLWPWPGFLPYPSGSNCGVRASILRELGGFDETYALGGDDVEFFWRFQLAGHEICFAADAVIAYRERAGLYSLGRQFFQYGQADAHLYRDFRSQGMPRNSLLAAAREWAHLGALAPWYWANRARRRQWVKSAARRLGRFTGSTRFRVRYL